MEPPVEPDRQSPNEPSQPEIVDDTESDESLEARGANAELDGQKIRQLAALRRGAIRARSWCLIAAGVGVIGAVQLLIKAVQNVRHERTPTLRAAGFSLFAVAGVMLSIFFLRRSAELKREIASSPSPPPTTPPDFSQLSDGSQRWKNLEDIQ